MADRALLGLAAFASILLTVPASALTFTCVPQDMGDWQSGSLGSSSLASDEPAATPFTINLETGAFERPMPDGVVETVQYQILTQGTDDPDSDNEDFVALDLSAPGLIRIKLEGGVWSFLRDYGRTLEVGTCSLESE